MSRRSRSRWFSTFTLVSAIVLAASLASGQPAGVTLGGRVTDGSGTPIVGAHVRVRQPATAAQWALSSDSEGRFLLPSLPPGVFDVEVSQSDFLPWAARSVSLSIGQQRHFDVRLEVSSVTEQIEVASGEGPNFTAAVDKVIPSRQIDALPLNGRNFLELALLVPGNQPVPVFDPTKTNSVMIGSAGQLGRGGNVTVDGQDDNDDLVGGPLINLPIDAVQEFQIATNRFAADLGGSASSAINVVTRSGGNQFHATAGIFSRDDAWQGLPATFDRGAGRIPFDRQQTSAAAGGALRRDHAFWFAAGEYRNQDGAVLAGRRDSTARVIRREFAATSLDDGLWTIKVDSGSPANRLTVRYAGQKSTDLAASGIERALGSESQRQTAANEHHHVLATWSITPTNTLINVFSAGASRFGNRTQPVEPIPQFTYPSLQDGASFRVPQETSHWRLQLGDTVSLVRGAHLWRAGSDLYWTRGAFELGVFRHGRIEFAEDFAQFDRTGDGRVDDGDLLFDVTLRSLTPGTSVALHDVDNFHVGGFIQDDWRVSSSLQLNAGVRYEFDAGTNNQGRVASLNPLVLPLIRTARRRDTNNVGPRVGLVWAPGERRTTIRAGYGIYYDRIILQIPSLERLLDGRALSVVARAGNSLFVDTDSGRFLLGGPTVADPFTGPIVPGAGASGIHILDARLQNPMVQEFHLGFEHWWRGFRTRVDALHNQGTHFLIGRTVGEVFNPVAGGSDRVVNIESSARANYDALLVAVDKRFSSETHLTVGYTLSKSLNYANDDQLPLLNGPIDPGNLRLEYGPAPNDRRHRLVTSLQTLLRWNLQLAAIWTLSSGVPMDIMMPSGASRVPVIQRNAGGRLFRNAGELNAFLELLNAGGGLHGLPLPLVSPDAKFSDHFNSVDLRVSRTFRLKGHARIEPMLEVFNVFNLTNILGSTNLNYSGFSNVLVRDSADPREPGYLRSSTFGRAVSTAGGVFGAGGPRAFQLGIRTSF